MYIFEHFELIISYDLRLGEYMNCIFYSTKKKKVIQLIYVRPIFYLNNIFMT